MAKEHSRFTEPEMEAALQLIQLSGESDVDLRGFSHSSGEVLATIKKTIRRGKEVVGDHHHDESQGSSTSDVTSAPPRRFTARRFVADDEDEDEDEDVAGTGSKRRRKRKKFRSVSEIYKISVE